MWVLVFIYFYETMPFVEKVTVADTMENCFLAREALSMDVGKGNGYFIEGQQAVCIKIEQCPRGGMVDTRHLKCLALQRTGSSPVAGTKRTPLAQLVRAERS